MNYVDKNLIPGETVVYRRRSHGFRTGGWWYPLARQSQRRSTRSASCHIPLRLDPRGDTRRHQHSDVDTDPHASELD